jgi:hypothetical protein
MLERRLISVIIYTTLFMLLTMFGVSIYNYFCEQSFIRIDDSCVQIRQGFSKDIICHQSNPYVIDED